MGGWTAVPRDWIASLGDIIRFCAEAFGDVFNGRVFKFFGEALRQAGILILGSALVVMGVKPVTFLAATRLLAAWMVLPFIYISAVGVGFLASYLAVVKQIGEVSSGGYFLIFWMFQNPPDLLVSVF